MTLPPRPAPSHVPTLTEVIELPSELPSQPPSGVLAEEGAALSPALPQDTSAMVAEPSTLPPPPAVVVPLVSTPPPMPAPVPAVQAPPALPPRASSGVDEAAMAQRVLIEVQRQIDGMLEYRLREALTPILARTSEALVRELRQELSKTMRDVVSRAVAQEVARQRTRP